MTQQQSKSRSLTLAIPRSDDECLKSTGVAPTVARAIASMARIDGVVTPEEYEKLAIAVDILSECSDNKLLFRVLILHSLLEDVTFDKAISELATVAKNQSEKIRNLIFDAVKPLLICQATQDRKKITQAWITALNLSKDKIREVATETKSKGLLEVDLFRDLIKLLTNKADNTKLIEKLSNIFQDKQLKDAINKFKNKKLSASKLNKEISKSAQRVLINAESVLPSLKIIEEQEDRAKKFHVITETLIDQIRSRLNYTYKRLKLQQDVFAEDFRTFLDYSLDSVEIGMRDLIDGRANWTDKTIWNKFSNTQAYHTIVLKFERLKYRYDRMFDLWRLELSDFSKEANHSIRNILDNVDPIVFSGLVKTDHGVIAFKNQLDQITSNTLGLASLGAIGTVALLATNAVSAAAIIPIVTSPVGWVIGGVVGLSALWKMFSEPEKRKREMIQEKRSELRKSLEIILSDPITQHQNLINEVSENFFSVANHYYAPIARDARLSVMQAKLEAKIITKIKEDIRKTFDLAKAVSSDDIVPTEKIGQFAKSSYDKIISFVSKVKHRS